MATFNGRPIDGELRTMRFRIRFDWPDDSVKRFIAEHPNIDILSINTSFTTRDFGATTIWYMEGNKPEPEMNSGAPESKSKWYLIKSPGGQYLKARRQNSSICEFTDYRCYAQPFDKEAAERIIVEHFGKGYMMEEL